MVVLHFANQAAGQFNLEGATFSHPANDVAIEIKARAATKKPMLKFTADGDAADAGDKWRLLGGDSESGAKFEWQNDIASAGAYVSQMTLVPNATPANSELQLAGNVKLGGNAVNDSLGGTAISVDAPHASNPGVIVSAGTGRLKVGGSGGLEGPAAVQFDIRGVNGQDTRVRSGDTAGDLLLFQDAATKSQALTADYLPLSSATGEIDSFITNFGAGSSIINAINAAASGAPAQVNKYVESMSGGLNTDFADTKAISSIVITNAASGQLTGAVAIVLKKQDGTPVTFTAGSGWTITEDNASATATSLQGAINGDAGFSATVSGSRIVIKQAAVGVVPAASMSKSGGTSTGLSLGGDFTGGGGQATVPGSTAIDLSLVSDAELAKIVDVLLNGQLLVSGAAQDSNGIEGAITEDYKFITLGADAAVEFNFDLEVTDTVQVVVR